MRSATCLALILLIASNPGCASVGVRTGAYSHRAPIYPATAVDSGLISYVVARPFVSSLDPTFSSDAQEGLMYLFAPAAIIDFPLAVALDTLLLPYDLHRLHNKEDDCQGFSGADSFKTARENESRCVHPSEDGDEKPRVPMHRTMLNNRASTDLLDSRKIGKLTD